MKKLMLAGLVLGLVGCATTPTPAELNWNPSEGELHNQILNGLKDPDSAKFGKVHASYPINKATGERYLSGVCIMVNAKNSYGGYTGFKRAYITMDSMYITDHSQPCPVGGFTKVWE